MATCRYGLKPGARLHASGQSGALRLHRPADQLAKLYIEPTSFCNLDCITCMHNTWDEPTGTMSEEVFDAVLAGLREFTPVPSVFFGGFGEPLSHPRILDMVARVKALGGTVELISNGTLLTEEMSRELIRAGLDTLWVSLDGATPESYQDIRLGALLPKVLENLRKFRQAVARDAMDEFFIGYVPRTSLGIAFVAMRRNIADLPKVVKLGQALGADKFLVTNVLPYTPDLSDQMLYRQGLGMNGYRPLNLPQMDLTETTYEPVYEAMRRVYGSWVSFNPDYGHDRCPFIEGGAGAITWDGGLSPCLPLLHSHITYPRSGQYDTRFSRRWTVGNLREKGLVALWHAPEHVAFREKVQAFDFPPCVSCGGCEFAEENEEDCVGNQFPTCGGCLWAQGLIHCP